MPLRLGFDVGGTFTDFVLYDDTTGRLAIGKQLTTPKDPSISVLAGIRNLMGHEQVPLTEIVQAIHATTLATNTVIQRSGDMTGLITTKGFRDVLEIGRQKRYELYDIFIDKPVPLIPRHLIAEVTERIAYDGTVLIPLAEAEVCVAVRAFVAQGVRSVVVSLLHAYSNPAHEQRIEAIIRAEAPGLFVCLSSTVSPVYREYERTNTTAMNAYTMPAVKEYLERIERALHAEGFGHPLYVMQSNGGIATVQAIAKFPVRIIESGPAAGALSAAFYGRATGYDHLISFDMGGTTAKICLIERGKPALTTQLEVDKVRLKRGSGLVVNVPAIDMIEIGAGGGSLARVEMGTIKVGPESAGADPGPMCYGLGGESPTVTDAAVMLGYLNPDYFLGGRMRLDMKAAQRGIEGAIAKPLGMSLIEAAWGVYEVVTHNMSMATRIVSIGRGKDPRRFSFFAFGGAGPVHGARLARLLGAPRVLFPVGAGVESAIGLLVADPSFDFMRTYVSRLDGAWDEIVNRLYAEMETEGLATLEACGVPGDSLLYRSADMRYVGQGYEITVPLPSKRYEPGDVETIKAAFLQLYADTYGYSDPAEPVEVVNWRLTALRPGPKLELPRLEKRPDSVQAALKGARSMYFPELGSPRPCPTYDRYALSPDAIIHGPAVLEERESTVVIPPGDMATVDAFGTIVVTIRSQ